MTEPEVGTREDRFGSRPQEVEVSASVLDMSVSLDGYIADPNDFLGGDDGERLHKWADADLESGQPAGQIPGRMERGRCGPRGAADGGAHGSLGR
jgi:hypothetical protein